MANEVEFKLKITTDGKDTFHNLTIDAQSLDEVVRRVTESAKKASDEIQEMAMKNLNWDTLTNAMGQFNSGLQNLVGGYDSFDKSMRAVNTMAGKGKEGFEALTDSVRELSYSIPMAREELAGGLYQVISNGVPEDNWISFLEQSSKAAVGGIANLGQTVTVTSTIIKNYGLEWDAAGSIQDKIQMTAKNGVTSFEQLAAALPRVSGSASQLGISLDELMAVFATTTGVTGNTAEVSTQLAAVLTALIKPSSEAAQAAERMGISFNAASIKEAGGLQNFLQMLDTTINEYSARTGELKETIYGNLFGSAEALRVLTSLTGEQKDKFTENIQAMADSTGTIDQAFGDMTATGDANTQMLKNQISVMTDMVASFASGYAPIINLVTGIGMATMTAMRFKQTVIAMVAGIRTYSSALQNNTTVMLLNRNALAASGVLMRIHRTLLASLTAATGSLTAATVALTAVYTMGLSLVIMGIASLFTSTGDAAEEAARKQDILKESTEVFKSAVANVKGEIDMEISALRQLIKNHGDETDKVEELNRKYGEALGYHKTAAEWYDILISKSKAYCQAIGYEAQAKVLASQRAAKELELDNIRNQKQTLEKSGKDKKEVTSVRGGVNPSVTSYTVNTKEYDRLIEQERALEEETGQLQQQFDACMEKMQAGMEELETVDGPQTASTAVDVMSMSYTELGTAIEDTEKKLKKLAPTETAEINRLSTYNKQLKARKDALGKSLGLGNIGGKGRDTKTDITISSGSLKALEQQLSELKERQEKAPIEKQLTFTQDIVALEDQISEIKERLKHAKFEARYTLKPVEEGGTATSPIQDAMKSSIGKGGAMDGFKIPKMDMNKPLSDMEAWNNALDTARQKNAATIESLSAMGGAMGALGNAVGGAAGQWLEWGANCMQAIATAIPQIMALIGTQAGQATTNTAVAATGAAAAVSSIPIVGPVLAIAAVASVLAALASIPKFANGGLAYGPTLGLFGEYAGASNNPEVVAPLNKLKQLIQPVDGMSGGRVEFVIDGRTLKGILNKVDNFNSRTR